MPLIVTGANHRYARTLVQFLCSAVRYGEHHRLDWIVYDLGLTGEDRELLSKRFPWVRLRDVNFSTYPPHVAVETGSFGWKPILLEEASRGRHGPVFWFDAATLFRSKLEEPLVSVARSGLWSLKGQTPLMGRADARVIEALNVPPEVAHLPERVAGAIGFDTRQPIARDLLMRWAELAKDPRFILPDNPDPNHRYDQTLLSSLLLTAMFRGEIELGDEEVDISSVNPVRYLTTRNKLWSWLPVWLDAPARAWYHVWKSVDRGIHRLRIFDDTRIDGWKRRKRDHFSVKLRNLRDCQQTTIEGPPDGYFADPFIVQRDGGIWLFVEEFAYRQDRGFLTVLGLNERLAVTSIQPIQLLPDYVSLDCHASFPYVLDHDGKYYMIPETHERRVVDLFVCEKWPSRWQLARRLLSDLDAADSMVVQKDGLWYLITSVQGTAPNRHLEIHYTDDLLSGRLTPHPINLQKIYSSNANGTGRNAGYIGRQADGSLIRLMQDSPNHYGEGVRLMRIITLTPTEFHEEPVDSIDFLPDVTNGFPTHHATRSGDILAFDTRDRVG